MNSTKPQKSASLGHSIVYAGRGLRRVILYERNLRWQLGAFLLVMIAGVWLDLSITHLSILVLTSAAVIAAECFNSALEYMEDIVEPQYHEAVRHSKDVSAAAVLVLSLASLIIAGLVFIPALLV